MTIMTFPGLKKLKKVVGEILNLVTGLVPLGLIETDIKKGIFLKGRWFFSVRKDHVVGLLISPFNGQVSTARRSL